MSYIIEDDNTIVSTAKDGSVYKFKQVHVISHNKQVVEVTPDLLPDDALPIARWLDVSVGDYSKLQYVKTPYAKYILSVIKHGGNAKKIVPQINALTRYYQHCTDKEERDIISSVIMILGTLVEAK